MKCINDKRADFKQRGRGVRSRAGLHADNNLMWKDRKGSRQAQDCVWWQKTEMLTEIPVPYYAKDILTLSASLTKADITPYHLGSSPPTPAEDFSPDIITKLAIVVRFLAALFCQNIGVKEPRDNLSQSKFGLCRRSPLIPRYPGYWRWSECQCVRSCHLE